MSTCRKFKCPLCEELFAQEPRFYVHLASEHDVSDPEKFYVDTFHSGIRPTCECSKECDVTLKWHGWKSGFTSKYARGHNARVDSVYLDPDRQREFAAKRSASYASGERSVWNKGLTRDTDDRVSKMSDKISASLNEGYASGRIVDWRDTDPDKALDVAAKISETKRAKFASGVLKSWNEGLTKETHPSLLSASKKISARYDLPDAGNRIKIEELVSRIARHSDKFKLLSDPEEYKRRRVDKLDFVCVKCGSRQKKSLAMLEETPVCFSCAPRESKCQIEIFEFVKSLGFDAVSNDRSLVSPLEVDVLVPTAKLAIEYNGLFWHSSTNIKDSLRHEKKKRRVREAGYDFFTVFEDEWRDKRTIVSSMISHRLGLCTERTDARKTSISELTSREAREFFDSTHLDGSTRASVTFCLRDVSGKVVAAMALRRPFHKSRSERLEIARYSTASGVSVRGGLGKLTKFSLDYAKKNGYLGLLTYVDTRIGSGASYAKTGVWKLESEQKTPRFWWTDYTRRYDRFKYKADKKRGMTQAQVAEEAGVVQIFGCSNLVFIAD